MAVTSANCSALVGYKVGEISKALHSRTESKTRAGDKLNSLFSSAKVIQPEFEAIGPKTCRTPSRDAQNFERNFTDCEEIGDLHQDFTSHSRKRKEVLSDDEDMVVKNPSKKCKKSCEAVENPERVARTVFVGNLPVTLSRKKLKQMFAIYGEVESVRFRSAFFSNCWTKTDKLIHKFVGSIVRNMEDPHEQNKGILKALETVAKKGLDSLDLNINGIQKIPRGLGELNLSHLKYFYLQGNNISFLPDEFFPSLQNLVWLDLRDNKLHEIPQNIGEHRNIKTLLLGRNQLKFLPLELGVIRTLTGLNLSNNPLKEPPHSVVERGVHAIKHYLLIKLGVNPENFKYDATESKYHRTESGSDSSHTVNVEKKNNCRDGIDILQMADGSILDNSNQGTSKEVCPREAMAYYGALLGNIPKSYIFKPWKTGVFFKKEEMGIDPSLKNFDKDNNEKQ